MNQTLLLALALLAGTAAGAAAAWAIRSALDRRGVAIARGKARTILDQAERDAEARLEAASLEAKVRLEAAEARAEEESQQRLRDLEEQRLSIERRDKDLQRRVAY